MKRNFWSLAYTKMRVLFVDCYGGVLPTLSHVSPIHVATQISTASEQWEPLPLTYLEDKVYTYLKSHTGEVCDREEIKQVVWEREYDLPGNSALQKIIERIREKIEPDPNNPRYLIAVRGQVYMLREDPLLSNAI